jgi:hypothetical protein
MEQMHRCLRVPYGFLTPTASSSDDSFAVLAALITRLGAEVVALEPQHHDDLVAIVSHVPHLTAATLMRLADNRSEEHLALLRLAAGGFRDMTRIASGRPGIWLDICEQNRDAIVRGLDSVIGGLVEMREIVATGNRGRSALVTRSSTPCTHESPHRCRISGGSRRGFVFLFPTVPGAAADVFTLSGELAVNIYDFEVVHSAEGDRGVMVTVIRAEHAQIFRGGLLARGFPPRSAISRMSNKSFRTPLGPLHAEIAVPGSKSIANRALICALLAEGESRLVGLPDGDDTAVILGVLDQMKSVRHDGNDVIVSGSRKVKLPGIIDAQLAGTSSRFLTAVAALGADTNRDRRRRIITVSSNGRSSPGLVVFRC